MQRHIKTKTGFIVHTREKQHLTVLQHLRQPARSVRKSDLSNECVLRRDGNCIPAAVAILLDKVSEVQTLLSDGDLIPDHAESNHGSYEDVEQHLRVSFVAVPVALTSTFGWPAGDYLLHSENAGMPHSVGLAVQDNGQVIVSDARNTFELDTATLDMAILNGIDKSLCMVFELHADEGVEAQQDIADKGTLRKLLSLQAGGSNDADADKVEVSSDDGVLLRLRVHSRRAIFSAGGLCKLAKV